MTGTLPHINHAFVCHRYLFTRSAWRAKVENSNIIKRAVTLLGSANGKRCLKCFADTVMAYYFRILLESHS